MILGGGAQSDAWGQVLQEFPHLDPDERQWARAIGAKSGRTPLRCDLLREVRDPQAQAGGIHRGDDELGIHYTSPQLGAGGGPAGSIGYVMKANGTANLYRLGDGVDDNVSLIGARRLA